MAESKITQHVGWYRQTVTTNQYGEISLTGLSNSRIGITVISPQNCIAVPKGIESQRVAILQLNNASIAEDTFKHLTNTEVTIQWCVLT